MVGEHYIKGWSRTQNCVTLSSGEAELVAMCKVTAETIGILNMAADWGEERHGTILVDSAAALAIAKRKGSGKLRHINIGLLWVQEKEQKGETTYKKIEGSKNPPDLMTKYVNPQTAATHMRTMNQGVKEGRAEGGLKVQKGKANKQGTVA